MLAVVVTASAATTEIAADRLWSLGVVAVEERTVAAGVVELWTSLGDDAVDATTAQLDALGFPWRFEQIDERVADTWRDFAEPTWIGADLVVVPAWQELPPDADRPDVVAIRIEPGATFGMGDHPTTVLSMRALRDVVDAEHTVLDVGCGSGVLAIAACRFGASSATAIDISAAAVPTTRANAERNAVGERVIVSTTPLAAIDASFDVVVANILAPVLIDLADDLVRVLAPRGSLVVSGILAAHHEHVLAALAPLRPVARIDLDGWTSVTLRR